MQSTEISQKSAHFPDKLRNLDIVPESINIIGKLPSGPYIAIVGTRKPTVYGEHATYQLARELAGAGAVIVSGLARGIDGIAHQAALDAGGKTVAVLAHGLNRLYPARHLELAKQIVNSGGALVSEYPLSTPPLPWRFVERNRIIAALADVTIVTEAGVKSGALITANRALNMGRSVMAVPGNITSENAAGPNNLIRQGATIITSATDVIAELGFIAREQVPVPAKSHDEAKLLKLLKNGPASTDNLIEATGLSAAGFANIITLMEITGKVRNLGAGRWAAR